MTREQALAQAKIWLMELKLAGMDPYHYASVRLSPEGPCGSSWLNRVGLNTNPERIWFWVRYADAEGRVVTSADITDPVNALAWYLEKKDKFEDESS